jgi:TolB-like protein/class 3 adenylate cyclase
MEERLPRKLAAILHADVVGYSRLAAENEDTTHRKLKESLDRISMHVDSFHGRVINYSGDAVLAMFESVMDAVSCAVAIQHEITILNQDTPDERKLLFRIGVNLGDVIEDDGDIFGDGVNVAARLEGLATPGGICIADSVYTAIGNKLPLEYEDIGTQSVKNIAEPVRAYQVNLKSGAEPPRPNERRKPIERPAVRNWRSNAIAIVIVIIIAIGLATWFKPWDKQQSSESGVEQALLTLPSKPSVAVLPFDNLSNNPDQSYFADGLTEDLITNLSLYRQLFVIARNSTFVYKGKAVDVKRIGRELGVAYVVEGSVRRENNRVRINAQLIDAQTGDHVWAEKFDRELTDVFAIQDEITQAIAGRLEPEIAKAGAENSRNIATENLDAWDLYLQASAALAEFNRESLEEAVLLAETAIIRDGNFAAPHVVIARAKGWQYFYGWTNNPEQTLSEAIKNAQTAIRLDSSDATGYAALGYLHRFHRDEAIAVTNLERAVELNPNDANIRLEFAHTLDWFRLQKRALPQIVESIRLSPRDPRLQMMFFFKAHILFHLNEFEASLEAAREMSSTITSDSWRVNYHLVRAANLAELGRSKDAFVEIENARAVNPKLSLQFIEKLFGIANNHPGNREAWLESLRKAGMPEELQK